MIALWNKLSIWHKDVIVLMAINIAIVSSVVGVRDSAAFILMAFFPGVLILRLLDLNFESTWERITHSVALSVSMLMLGGLFINTLLPLYGITHPLSTIPVLISLNTAILGLSFSSYLFNKKNAVFPTIHTAVVSIREIATHALFFILPVSTIMGATILNNGGSGIFAYIGIGAVVACIVYGAVSSRPLREDLLMSLLYCASLALLFTMSMRSWHVIGFDVNQELGVFRLTHMALYWSMNHIHDAYNACLSITILPTIFSNFFSGSDEYLYKFVFQLIFALFPIGVFYFIKQFTTARISFIAVVMLIGQAVFSNMMPALIRQEFGFLYFILILLVLFSDAIAIKTRYALLSIYGMSIIVSHYSTTYILILLLGLTVGMNICLMIGKKVFPRLIAGHITHMIPIWFVIFLAAGTFMWGGIITKTSNNLQGFVDHSISNIAQMFTYDTFTRAIFQTFSPYPHYEDFAKYLENDTLRFRAAHVDLNFYDLTMAQASNASLQRIELPQHNGYFGPMVQSWSASLFQVLKLLVNNVFIILGMCILIYQWYVGRFNSSELVLLCASEFIALALFLVLPDALNQYNIDRLYFQLLMMWSFLSVLAGVTFLSFLKKQYMFAILGIVYGLVLLFYTSLIFVFTGGQVLASLRNSGIDYEKFYAHEGEIYAAQWIAEHHESSLVFGNTPGANRLKALGTVDHSKIVYSMMPSLISKDSYVFLTHMNTSSGLSTYLFNNEEFAYTVPTEFLNKNKDLLYTNEVAHVYR